MTKATFNPAAQATSSLMLGSVVCTTMLAGADTDGGLAAVEVRCPNGAGPGPHTDPWRESFYVLEGEFEFQLEADGQLQARRARPGDAISIPAGVGHAFRAVSDKPGRVLILSVPAGLETFFAEAGEPVTDRTPPQAPRPFDHERFGAATDRHRIRRFVSA
jgi:quercetin dioxygenase-like cupin family protein